MTMADGKIYLDENLSTQNLSEIISGLSYHIAMEFLEYVHNDSDYGDDEWEFEINAKDDCYTLKIKLSEWNLKALKKNGKRFD